AAAAAQARPNLQKLAGVLAAHYPALLLEPVQDQLAFAAPRHQVVVDLHALAFQFEGQGAVLQRQPSGARQAVLRRVDVIPEALLRVVGNVESDHLLTGIDIDAIQVIAQLQSLEDSRLEREVVAAPGSQLQGESRKRLRRRQSLAPEVHLGSETDGGEQR